MKKKNLMPLAKSAFALSLAATMVVPTGVSVAAADGTNAGTSKEVTVPEPIKTIDFNRGLLGVAQDEFKKTDQIVGKSEELYVQKTAEEVGGTEKVDANGLVYTGDKTNARYHRQNVSNQPTTAWDEEKGTVLKIGKTQTIPAIYKTKSAGTSDEGVAELLDKEIPYEVSGAAASAAGVLVQPEKTVSSEIIIDNPYGDEELRQSLVEYSEFDAPDTSKNGRWTNKWNKSRYQPTWEKGLTFSYWIKVPSNEDGTYKRGSVLRWELDNQLYYQADDYAKHLTCKYWDVEAQKFADQYYNGSLEEYKKATLKEESGVIYTSEYYFKYAEVEGTDENGKPIPAIRQGATLSGPVYDHKFLRNVDGIHTSLYYQANPNYKRGYVLLADGSYEEMNSFTDAAYYEGYHTLDIEANSKVRMGYNDGELQIDTDNSIFWVPDNNLAININPKAQDYGKKQGQQNGDCFFMNSWQEGATTDKYGNFAYEQAKEYALSPVTSVEEDAEGNRVATPNGNVDKWHQVTVTLQNDWVEFWVDGEMVDVREYYSMRGNSGFDFSESFKRLNKGTGLRGGYGSEKTKLGNIAYGNYVCRLLMDWMTDEEAKLHIGGGGQYAKEYAQAETSCDFSIDDLKFYDQLLTEEQIKKAYEDEVAAMNAPVNVTGTAVDITTVSDVSVDVENAVKTEKVTIKGESVDSVHIAANPKQSTTTGAKVANPFAGKNLEGATIGYWVKQDDAERNSLLSFMDDEDVEIQSPKDGGAMAKSILYVKNNGEASYIDGFTSSTSASVKNTYVTSADATGAAAILEDSAKDWMYVTATMTNAGIKYYINGELVENTVADKAGVRFLDGYYSRLRDEEDVQTKLGAFGGTNNQGTRTLMDFLTSKDTSIYFGYSITKGGMSCEKTSGCQFAAVKYVDAALTDEQVKTLYANSLGSEDVKLGDVDGDGEIKLKDAQLALKIALNLIAPTPVQKKAADVDKNGKVELKDAQAILKVALNLASGF